MKIKELIKKLKEKNEFKFSIVNKVNDKHVDCYFIDNTYTNIAFDDKRYPELNDDLNKIGFDIKNCIKSLLANEGFEIDYDYKSETTVEPIPKPQKEKADANTVQ